MIYIYRSLWVIGWIPVITLEIIMTMILLSIFPFIAAGFYIKTGSLEGAEFSPLGPVFWLDGKYKNLAKKLEY